MSNLDLWERRKIEYYWRGQLGVRAMARLLKRDHTVIARELERNGETQER